MRSRSQEVDPDLLAIVEVSDASGDLIVVSPREQSLALPHEFASVLPGRLPVSLALGRGAMGRRSRGDWATADEQPENVLCRAAQENKTLSDGVKWNWKMHTANTMTTIKLPWTIQAVPLSELHYLFLVQSVMRWLPPRFGLEWYLQRHAAFADFVHAEGPSVPGNCESRFCYPTDAIIRLILKLGEAITGGYRF